MSDETMRDDDMRDDDATTGGRGAALPEACANFEADLADYLEGTLEPTARAAMDAHRAGCARCEALLADLEGIALAASALPPIVPSSAATESMWNGVAARIAVPAVPITAARSMAARRSSPLQGWRRQALAAAALVLVTAGVTYSVTHRIEGGTRHVVAVVDPRSGKPIPPDPTLQPLVPVDTGAQLVVGQPGAEPTSSNASDPLSTAPGGAGMRPVGNSARSSRPSATTTYEREIGGLRRILAERREELDSTTVAVLEQNLAVIDQAIRQSREALARDPRSRFLGEQLNSALDKKLELLRTAALLPSRT